MTFNSFDMKNYNDNSDFLKLNIVHDFMQEKLMMKILPFYKTENRIGLWISYDKSDTLEYVNDSVVLIRKRLHYVYERYLYRIEGKNSFHSTG